MIRRFISALALAAIMVGVSPPAAQAHAGFVSSTPEPGATLGTAPGQVTLTFSEPLNTRLSRASVLTPDGSLVPGRVVGDDGIVVDLNTNQTGVYEVTWTTVSVVDGHALSGSFRFGVGVSPGAGAEGGTADEPGRYDFLVAVGRLVEDTSLLLLVGLLLIGRLARRDPALNRIRSPTPIGFIAAFVGGLLVVLGETLLATRSLSGGAILAYLTTGSPGWSRVARVILEGLGILTAWRWPRAQAPIVVAAIIALAAAGHAAAVQPQIWGVTVEAVHLLCAGVWAGGILALALQRPPQGWFREEGRTLLDRFTPPALAGFALTVGTGLIRAVQEVGSWSELLGSTYGLALLAKVVLVLLMVQLSMLAWRRIVVVPRGEAAPAILAIGAAALLSAFPLPPARQAETAAEVVSNPAVVSPISGSGALTLGSHAGSVLVGLTVTPGTPGPNELTIYVLSSDGPGVTAALPVKAEVSGIPVKLTQCADTCRQGSAALQGGEKVRVDVDAQGGGRATFHLPALPTPSGDRVLRRMTEAMGALTSYRLDEDLTSGLGTTVHTRYAFVSPNSFKNRVVESGSSFRTVWIGDTRYTQEGAGPWKVERGAPAVPVPTYIWDSFEPFQDARIVGSSSIDGLRTTEVAFAGGNQDLQIWFELWIDANGLVHRAQMRAPGHFMNHRYYDFDAPITIRPPEGVSG